MSAVLFLLNDTPSTETYPLSLHDALPISSSLSSTATPILRSSRRSRRLKGASSRSTRQPYRQFRRRNDAGTKIGRHTSELQSHVNLVCRLLLEKKKHSMTSHQCRTSHSCS